MFESALDFAKLIILFLVIFDPLASFFVFVQASYNLSIKKQQKLAIYSVLIAAAVSIAVLLFGELLLQLFSTTIDEFRIAGGIILGILGVKMVLGLSLTTKTKKGSSIEAVASVIGTPLLTGPAAITAIIISTSDYGKVLTGSAVFIVLLATLGMFLCASIIKDKVNKTVIQMLSTLLGLITLAWGIKFVMTGIQAIF